MKKVIFHVLTFLCFNSILAQTQFTNSTIGLSLNELRDFYERFQNNNTTDNFKIRNYNVVSNEIVTFIMDVAHTKVYEKGTSGDIKVKVTHYLKNNMVIRVEEEYRKTPADVMDYKVMARSRVDYLTGEFWETDGRKNTYEIINGKQIETGFYLILQNENYKSKVLFVDSNSNNVIPTLKIITIPSILNFN